MGELCGDLTERLDPGGEVPAGECECGALTYLTQRSGVKRPTKPRMPMPSALLAEVRKAQAHAGLVKTAADYIVTWPARAQANGGNLFDMACPKCGQRDKLVIAATTGATVSDDETDTGDLEWEDTSLCHCPCCSFEGTLSLFTFEGLDDMLLERARRILRKVKERAK